MQHPQPKRRTHMNGHPNISGRLAFTAFFRSCLRSSPPPPRPLNKHHVLLLLNSAILCDLSPVIV